MSKQLSDKQAHELSIILCEHYPTTGMAVTSGVTCECRFWESRPIRFRSGWDRLDVHRAEIAYDFLNQSNEEETE